MEAPQKPYREGLAGDLRDLRSKEKREQAKTLLTISKETERYKTAQEERQVRFSIPTEQASSNESREASAVEHAFELIKTHPDFDYVIKVNGKPFGTRQSKYDFGTKGWRTLYFNKNDQDIAWANGPTESQYSVSTAAAQNSPLNTFSFEADRGEGPEAGWYLRFKGWVAFRAPAENSFTEEHRPGLFLAYILRCPATQVALEAAGEPMKEYLLHPDTDEAKVFFTNLFDRCNQAWIPEYWEFVKQITAPAA